ncbi:ATP-dependent zinc metalloprotease FTSH 7 [Carex littledalei]|uniref:ATP-dependent zinc metalloprotease FTSH 7 n=1 Tax=Carex littledalei TaxID=544730 RepID=A0A833QP37_9POAL|nr:ATP-dependent zinc metalloprotease FTSH 7 [Carex littledalei]
MQGHLVDMVQTEVKGLLQSALEVALSVIKANPTVLEGLGAYLEGRKIMAKSLLRLECV